MAFKIVEEPFGQLTFMRIYQGTVNKGEMLLQPAHRQEGPVQPHRADARRQARRHRHGRGRRHRGRSWASTAPAAIPTPRSRSTARSRACSSPSRSSRCRSTRSSGDGADKLAQGAAALPQEDPTFRVHTDEETGETVIAGMGELHLEIYVERIRREYKVEVEVGAPKVSYREAPTKTAEFNYKHKKQTGGSGQYAHIVGEMEPLPEDAEEPFEFEDKVIGGRIPKEYIPSVEKGFRESLAKGPVAGYPVVGVKAILEDGSYHDVDSSDMAFQICARNCFRETFRKTKPVLLEPIMKVEIEVPDRVPRAGGRRHLDQPPRHDPVDRDARRHRRRSIAEVPLAETFGYSTDLRSMTQGQGTFTMEFAKYRRVPASIQDRDHRREEEEAAGRGEVTARR